MLGIHVRKQALNDLGRRASISDPRSAATNSWVKTPPGSSTTGGTRSCPRTGPAIPFILPDSRRTYKLTGSHLYLRVPDPGENADPRSAHHHHPTPDLSSCALLAIHFYKWLAARHRRPQSQVRG